jgi:hypothetical protein
MKDSESSIGEESAEPEFEGSEAELEGSAAEPVMEPAPDRSGPGADPDAEIVDGFPVLAEVRTIERPAPVSLPAVQVVVVAATGFVAGAATVALVKRRTAKKLARNGRGGGSRRPADLLPIAATRSFLVDVHVIAKPE